MFGSVTFSKKSSGVNHEKTNISKKKRTLSGRCLDRKSAVGTVLTCWQQCQFRPKLEETNWSGDVTLNQAFFFPIEPKTIIFVFTKLNVSK